VREEIGRRDQGRIVVWSSQSHNEEPLTALGWAADVYDWSPDGKSILVSRGTNDTHRSEVWLLTVADAPHAEVSARKIISDPVYDLFQSHFSPDGRWIVFEACKASPLESRIDVTLASGGRGLKSRMASIGPTGLAGLLMERQFTSFLTLAAALTCEESISIRPPESRGENRSK